MTEGTYANGIYRAPGARLSDLAGEKRLPVGNDNFRALVRESVFVDKSLLVADVLARGTAVSLYCRPRRFGKSLNLSMLQVFFEMENPSDPAWEDPEFLFRGLQIWEAEGGRWREHAAAYPVVRFTFNDVKKASWEGALATIRSAVASEYRRHAYLEKSEKLSETERILFSAIQSGSSSEGDLARSLVILAQLLQRHHDRPVVVLIDEYDAPVMAAATNDYYREAVDFLKGWLTGALKTNDALAFGVLTGVQRISKESIFSDLNNLEVDTPMSLASDERYGFTQAEVEALAAYREQTAGIALAREWYDGYRFGNADVYNPWSTLSFFRNGCAPGAYWSNTSGNGVLGQLVGSADERTLAKLYRLMEPNGEVRATLDLSAVFADGELPAGPAVWSLLYLAGYVTTEDVEDPTDTLRRRPLRLPNREIARVFRTEIVQRFQHAAGDGDRLAELHDALRGEDAETVAEELERILLDSASSRDLVRENSYHMLVLGLLFGMEGYGDPVSNREAGRGLFDVRVTPDDPDRNPVMVLELKWAKPGTPAVADLPVLAEEAVAQARNRAYASGTNAGAAGTVLWGLAFSGKDLAVTCERV